MRFKDPSNPNRSVISNSSIWGAGALWSELSCSATANALHLLTPPCHLACAFGNAEVKIPACWTPLQPGVRIWSLSWLAGCYHVPLSESAPTAVSGLGLLGVFWRFHTLNFEVSVGFACR